MRIHLFIIIFLAGFFIIACRKEVYKKDRQYPDLPAYSEKGLNVGGCFINDTAWLTLPVKLLSRNRPLYIESYPNGDSVVFLFNGVFKDSGLVYKQPHTLFIVLKNIRINSDGDLTKLNAHHFVLDGITNYGCFANTGQKIGKATGTLDIGKSAATKNSLGDDSPGNPKRFYHIVAGQFDMSFTSNRNYSITQGRFDISILQDDQFYIIQ